MGIEQEPPVELPQGEHTVCAHCPTLGRVSYAYMYCMLEGLMMLSFRGSQVNATHPR